ncbi:MAG: hypothetical protein V7K40_25930 [Nostoc sp.]|uniref:hypothetical protein n=1 Tax=Nostoc sp. TaxID=1180 RepID=UPI002FF508B9
MSQFDPKLGSFLLALIGAVSGWVVWWFNKIKSEKQQIAFEKQQAIQEAKAAAEKAVNEKRDFNHLVNSYKQTAQNISHGFEDIENQLKKIHDDELRAINNQLQEIKAYLIRNRNS